jgi:hypothetical protein
VGKKKWLWIALSVAIAVALGTPRIANAYKVWQIRERRATIDRARAALAAGADGLPEMSALLAGDPGADPGKPEVEADDAEIRRLVMEAEIGQRTPESQRMLLQIAAAERARWANFDPAAAGGSVNPGTRRWLSLGPQAARSQFNGTYYKAVDSGRATAVAVHPTKPRTVYLATSGGGVWQADDFGNFPFWFPITDGLGSLAIGAMSVTGPLDAAGNPTIWLGLGDFVDQQFGAVVKSSDGGTTWGTPIFLSTTSHPADAKPSSALNVRDIKTDPNDATKVLVATDDGFYMSTNGGATFNLIDLPNPASFGATREGTWQIVYIGQVAGISQWVVSGVYACLGANPPSIQAGAFACPGDTAHYNMGDFWKSTDAGATWTSIRQAGGLPAAVTGNRVTDIGRINFAAGATTDPTTTVLYAEASAAQETTAVIPLVVPPASFANATAAFLKSTDGGSTWTRIATGLNVGATQGVTPAVTPTALTNPTIFAADAGAQAGCTIMNLGHVQSWYNLTVAVDPGNPNRAIFGGDLCSAITKDGGATFQAASHWLPQGGSGYTTDGFLPYVHADWHTSLAIRDAGGQSVLFAGTDGGLFVTRNIWDVPTTPQGQWQQPDVGLATHLFYGIGTGDPTLGNPNVVFGGLQDNGTRWRLLSDESYIADFNAQNWDQILGGDGFGAAVSTDTTGQNPVYWISVNGARRYCRPRAHDCSLATRIENGVELVNWRNPGLFSGDGDPFLIRYTPLGDDTSGVLSASNLIGWKVFVDNFDRPSITQMTPTPVGTGGGIIVDGTRRTIRGMGFRASPYRYTIDGVSNSRISGGVTTSSTTAMGSFLTIDKPGSAPQTFAAVHGVRVLGACPVPSGTCWLGNGSDFAAPQNPASLGGTDSKQTWLASSNSVLTNPVGTDPAVLIPASIGHLFKTIDQGNTWVPFHGNGTGLDLPNVPIYTVVYDPTDNSDKAIWVGTELGVYRTTDGGNTWAPYGLGLPMVRVWDIHIANNGSLIRIATYGRGVWEIYPNSEPATLASAGNGDFDKNGVVDFFDMASLAARMGSNPDTTPRFVGDMVYDNLVDLDPTIPAGKPKTIIDETDLAALVAKFGGNP